MIIIVCFAFLLIAAFQIPRLVKRKEWKDLTVFCLFLFTGFVLNLLLVLGVEIPSPTLAIEAFLDMLGLHF